MLPVFGVPAAVGVCGSGCVRPAVDAEFRGKYRNTADQVKYVEFYICYICSIKVTHTHTHTHTHIYIYIYIRSDQII